MTTGGEGGMVTTNSETLWRSMWAFKDHGKSFSAVYERQHPPGFRWLHESFGTNWRMLEMQAVIGRIQLRRMADWTNKRAANARALEHALKPFSCESGAIRTPFFGCSTSCANTQDGGCELSCQHAYYKYYAYLRPQNLATGWSRDRVIEAINAEGVPCFQGSCSEVYLEKAFDGTGWRPLAPLPVAKDLGENSVMFLVHPTLTSQEMQKSVEVVAKVLSKASKL